MSDPTGASKHNVSAQVIIDIETDAGDINICTGTQSRTIDGTYYHAAGRLLDLGPIQDENTPSGRAFSLSVNNASSTLSREALKANLADNAVRVRYAELDRATNTWAVEPLRMGRVGQAIVGRGQITLECYTPMTVASSVKGLATDWSDNHQRNFIDGGDYIFRDSSNSAQKQIAF